MLTYSDLKTHLRIDHDEDDDYLTLLIAAAYEFVENYTSRVILPISETDELDCFPAQITLEKVTVNSVTSITYYDTDGNQQTLSSDDYYVNLRNTWATIELATDAEWPDTNEEPENIVVTYSVGYSSIPDSIEHAVKLIAGSLYEQRENHIVGTIISKVPVSAEYLLDNYTVLNL